MNSYKNLSNNDKDTETSDFLLAKALYHIEKDEADLYKKPRGKSYRQSKENKDLPDLTSLPNLTLLPHLSPLPVLTLLPDLYPRHITPPANHMTSSSESSDVEDEDVINTSLISFISQKKKFMLSLVSDPLSKYHARSDRLSTLQRLSPFRRFEKNAEKEMIIIRLEMREILGGKVLMYVNLTFLIFSRRFCKNHDHLTLMILQIAVALF